MSDNTVQNGGNSFMELIVTIIVIIALVFLFKYIWHGMIWAFDQYVDLIKVK